MPRLPRQPEEPMYEAMMLLPYVLFVPAQNQVTAPLAPPVPPSAELLERTLADAVRLAEKTPEQNAKRAECLLAVADAYVAADRPDDAKRFYRAAVVSAVKSSDQAARNVLRSVAFGQVAVRDDAEAAKNAVLSQYPSQPGEVAFRIARRDAPADSPLRTLPEQEAYRAWAMPEMKKQYAAQQQQMHPTLIAALDDSNTPPNRRGMALLQLLEMEPDNRAAITVRYLPAIAEAARKAGSPEEKAQALGLVAGIYHMIGDTTQAQTALTDAVEAAALIPEAEARLQELIRLLSVGVAQPPESPLPIPESLRNRAISLTLAAVSDRSKPKQGESPFDTVQRLVGISQSLQQLNYAQFATTVPLTLMRQAVTEAKKIPAGQREVALQNIAVIQARANAPDAVLETIRLSSDRSWRISTLLNLALVGLPRFHPPTVQNTFCERLYTAALTEARTLPTGPTRYFALESILRTRLTRGKTSDTTQSRAIFREMVALVPVGTGPLPPAWSRNGAAPAQVLLQLALLGQHTGDHQTARGLLARAAAITKKAPTSAPPGAAYLFASIARAQAFSSDFAGAKSTLQAWVLYEAKVRYMDEASPGNSAGGMRAAQYATIAGEQALARDFAGALATVNTYIPERFTGERSRALSNIALEMAAMRKGKVIPEPYPDYAL